MPNFNLIAQNDLLLIGISLGAAALIVLVVVSVYQAYKKHNEANSTHRQLQDLINDSMYDDDLISSDKKGIVKKWNHFWESKLKQSGWGRYENDQSTAGRDVFVVSAAAFLLLSAFTLNPGIGAIVVFMGLYTFSAFMQIKADKTNRVIDSQLIPLIFAIKANLKATSVIENAFVRVIDSTSNPIKKDLEIARSIINSGGSFKTALTELSHVTTSDDLRFLCRCMIQASQTGASLESQLDTITDSLENRQKNTNLINEAEKKLRPSMIVSIFVIPVMFIATYFMNDAARDFWFVEPLSWILFLAAVALWVIGIVNTRRLVNQVKRL